MKECDTIVQYRTRQGTWKRMQGVAKCELSNGVCIVKFIKPINKLKKI